MEKLFDGIIQDPIDKLVTIAAVFIAAHFFKKYAKQIDEKINGIESLEKSIKASVASIKNSFESYKQSITEASDKIKDDFYELRKEIIDYQNDVFRKIQGMELQAKKTSVKGDIDIRQKIDELEKKIEKSNNEIVLFSKRVAKEFIKEREESEKAKEQQKKILQNHKNQIEQLKKKVGS